MTPLRRVPGELESEAFDSTESMRRDLAQACGWIPVWKPTGISSFDLIRWLRRAFVGIKPRPKLGHTGTLDPFAEGLVLIAVGPATRLITLLEEWPKTYHATCTLGTLTDTLDLTGTIVESREVPDLTLAQIRAACAQFVGEIRQTPPAYSALKQGGEALYRKARRGEELDIAPRIVTITRCEAVAYDVPEISLEIDCGGGTYIRSLSRDIAEVLGTVGHCSALQRVVLGPLTERDGWRLEGPDEVSPDTLVSLLRPADWALDGLAWVALDDEARRGFLHGQPVEAEQIEEPQARHHPIRVYDGSGALLGIATQVGRAEGPIVLQPKLVLASPDA